MLNSKCPYSLLDGMTNGTDESETFVLFKTPQFFLQEWRKPKSADISTGSMAAWIPHVEPFA